MKHLARYSEAAVAPVRIIDQWLANRTAGTVRQYKQAMSSFCAWSGLEDAEHFLRRFSEIPMAGGCLALADWRDQLVQDGLAPATINGRLSAIRSFLKLGHMLGALPCAPTVENVKACDVRDSRGPSAEAFNALLAQASEDESWEGARALAVIRLLHDLGLRRAEVCSLDLASIDQAQRQMLVVRKGGAAVWLSIPQLTFNAVFAWIAHRGDSVGPLLQSATGKRLSGEDIRRIIKKAAGNLPGRWNPHGLRHRGITAAAAVTGGDLRKVIAFSGHKDVRTVQRYIDDVEDLQGDVANQVAGNA
ncbi:MAG: integrase/recombinase XerC [Acidimicrobiales bacterium]|jgi:integrase/recombinase XerC